MRILVVFLLMGSLSVGELVGGRPAAAVTLDFEALVDSDLVTTQFAGLTFANTIALASGEVGGTLNELELFENAVVRLTNTAVTNNTSLVPGDINAFHGGQGVVAGLRSTVSLLSGSAVSNNAGNGILIFSGSAITFRPSTVNANGGFGFQCFGAEASFDGDTAGIGPNTSGAISTACTGF